MLTAKKRGTTWRVEGVLNKHYVRLSLKTRDASAAKKSVNEIELALIEGPDSKRWLELRRILPEATFQFFANAVDWKESPQTVEAPSPTWIDLVREFSANFKRKILQGDRSEATWRRYELTCNTFTEFLKGSEISRLQDISR